VSFLVKSYVFHREKDVAHRKDETFRFFKTLSP